MRSTIHKGLAAIVLVSFLSTNAVFLFPQKASAQAGAATSCVAGYASAAIAALTGAPQNVVGVPKSQVGDTAQNVVTGGSANSLSFNNCILKPLAQTMIITIIRQIGSDVVEWINSGFDGKPQFVTDFGGTLLDAADQTIGTFIEGTELGWLCNDFSFQIRLALALKYSKPFKEQVRCTLSDIGDNVNNFVDNNGGAGWDNWLKLTTEPNNNAYGAFLIADSELAQRAAKAVDIKEKKISFGEGFLDFETCDEWETVTETAVRNAESQNSNTSVFTDSSSDFMNFDTGLETIQFGDDGTSITTGIDYDSAFQSALGETAAPKCKKSSTKTPGKIIGSKLSSVLGQGEIQQAVADEIDEVIAATLNQLAQKMIQEASGLLGLSRKSSTKSPSYLDTYRARLYGETSSTGGVTAASSELDSYRIGSFDEASSLINNSGDSSVAAITQTVGQTVNSATGQQQQQLGSIIDTVGAGVVSSATTNSALLKSTGQSSGSNPSGATDGIKQTSQYMRGSATAGDEPDPWWEVNLGKSVKITEVRVWKVSDKPASQTLESFRVVVSDGQNRWTSGIIDGTVDADPVVVPVNQQGRTVRIEKIAAPYQCETSYRYEYFGEDCYYPLELAEVEVITAVTATETVSSTSGSTTGSTSGSSSSQSSSSSSSSTSSNRSSVVLTQANVSGSAFSMIPGVEGTDISPVGLSREYTVTFGGSGYTIPQLDVILYKGSSQIAFDSVLSGATVSLQTKDKAVNFQPGTAAGISLTSVNVAQGAGTKLVIKGIVLPPLGATYKIAVTARDASGNELSTANIDFVVQ